MIIFRVVKNFFYKTKLYNLYLSKNSVKEISFTPKDTWPGDPMLGDQLVQGYYSLANKKIYAPDEALWQVSNKSTYWLNEAHSFSWLRHLKARSGSLARKHARYLILEWLKLYENWDYTAWFRKTGISNEVAATFLHNFSTQHIQAFENNASELRNDLSAGVNSLRCLARKI